MLKLMVFDFDGTLVDTMTDVALAFNQALARLGHPTHPVAAYERFVGGNLEQVISRLLPEDQREEQTVNQVKELYRPMYAESAKVNTKPYPGIPALLEALAAMGIALTVHTNKAQGLVNPMIAQHFPNIPFAAVVGYREDRPAKPCPDAVLHMMEAAGATARETAYVGDGESDILTAEAAGVPLLFVCWGQGNAISRQDPRIAMVAESPGELLAYARERMNQ